MHIGFLSPDLSHNNGWAHYSLSLIDALHQKNIQTTIISATNSPDTDFQQHRLLPAVTPSQRFSTARMLTAVPRMASLFRSCDIIHCTAEPYSHLLATQPQPGLITVHGSYVHLPQIRRFPLNHFYKRAYQNNTLLCVSRYTAKIAENIVPGAKTIVVNNGVDAARFNDVSDRKISDVPYVITVGGVKARKGTLELVQAIAKVRETLPDIQCHIIGSTAYEPACTEKVRAEITRLKLENSVHLREFISEDDLMAEYAKAHVFVLPSMNSGWKFEGFGLVYLEASATGLPVIGTRDCGAEDAIINDVTGLLVSQKNLTAELPIAILDILTNPEKAQKMGAAGRQRAQSMTWHHIAEKTIAVYDTVLSAK